MFSCWTYWEETNRCHRHCHSHLHNHSGFHHHEIYSHSHTCHLWQWTFVFYLRRCSKSRDVPAVLVPSHWLHVAYTRSMFVGAKNEGALGRRTKPYSTSSTSDRVSHERKIQDKIRVPPRSWRWNDKWTPSRWHWWIVPTLFVTRVVPRKKIIEQRRKVDDIEKQKMSVVVQKEK